MAEKYRCLQHLLFVFQCDRAVDLGLGTWLPRMVHLFLRTFCKEVWTYDRSLVMKCKCQCLMVASRSLSLKKTSKQTSKESHKTIPFTIFFFNISWFYYLPPPIEVLSWTMGIRDINQEWWGSELGIAWSLYLEVLEDFPLTHAYLRVK